MLLYNLKVVLKPIKHHLLVIHWYNKAGQILTNANFVDSYLIATVFIGSKVVCWDFSKYLGMRSNGKYIPGFTHLYSL